MAQLIVFAAGSALMLYISRKGLVDRHSYGYYRFFGFEFVLLSIVANMDPWFVSPFAPLQLISWLALASSIAIAAVGFVTLRKNGKPASGVDDTTLIVTSGIYRFIRHPLYLSLILLEIGAVLKSPSLFGGILIVGGMFSFFSTARAEETFNTAKFGAVYEEYMVHTKMFVPYLF
ncbi:MAG TPA: isoprenylcysteine carboxylmethyltransferase family protein [Candidatus Kryptonia bacterium]